MEQNYGHKQTPVRASRIEGSIYLTQPAFNDISEKDIVFIKKQLVSCYKLKTVELSKEDDQRSIAIKGADYLKSILTNSMTIAVSCGSTLIETINHLGRLDLDNITIYPLNGSPTDEVKITDAMVLTYNLWCKFEPECKAKALVVPTGIPAKLFTMIEKGIGEIANKVLDEAKKADLFLFGVGNKHTENIKFHREKAELTIQDLEEMDVAGEINYHLFNSEGELLALSDKLSDTQRNKIKSYNDKFFSITAEDIIKVRNDSRANFVIVAGGDYKREAIRAALKGGLATTLITDMKTGAWLVNYKQ